MKLRVILPLATLLLSGCSLMPQLATPTRTTSAPGTTSIPDPSYSGTSDLSMGVTQYAPGERKPAPDLKGTTLTGSTYDVASNRGKVTVVNNWTSWCDPCREELPVLVSLANSATPKEVAFVGLDVNDTQAPAEARVKEFAIPYPSMIDDGAHLLARSPGVPPYAIPSTIVVDKHGLIAARIIGTVKPGQLEPILSELSAEK